MLAPLAPEVLGAAVGMGDVGELLAVLLVVVLGLGGAIAVFIAEGMSAA